MRTFSLHNCCLAAVLTVSFLQTIPLPAAASFPTTVTVHLQPAGRINPDIYGQYLEHVDEKDQCIYPALWDASSPHADSTGVRTDVAAAISDLSPPIVRWPGGCFADVYHWQDAIGPRQQRRPKPNLHWGGNEPNMFGTDEFLHLCSLTGMKPYINANIGTGSVEEACAWVDYCNGPANSPNGSRRAANGNPAPHNVKYWGVGNETWGHWEAGHADAATYATSLTLYAQAMRQVDPTIKVLAVGSEEGNDPAWDRAVLARAGSQIDYLTFHGYGMSDTQSSGPPAEKAEALAFTPLYFENRLRRMLRTISTSPTDNGTTRDIPISIDEWNVRRYHGKALDRREPRTQADAVFVAGMLNTMIRLSPRVAMANYVFLVNGHAPILVDGSRIVKSPLYHVFQKYRWWMTGQSLSVEVDAAKVSPPQPTTAYPGRKPAPDYTPQPVPYIDCVAALRADSTLCISLINRHPTTTASVKLQGPPSLKATERWLLTATTPESANTFAEPDFITPQTTSAPITDQCLCPPMSVTLIRCGLSVRYLTH